MDERHICIGGSIKALGNNRYGGYLVRFYPPGQKDFDGEWFSKATDFMLDEHPVVGKPVLFHHGIDDRVSAHKIGTFDKAEIDDNGLWAEWEANIRGERKEYIKRVLHMIDDGLLDYSSGSLPGAVRVDDTGHIKCWVIAEGSATHTPADWRSVANGNDGTRIQTLKSLTELTPREALPKEGVKATDTGDVEQNTIASKTLSLGAKMSDLRSKLKQRIKETMDSIIEEVIAEFSGEIAPEDVAAVADEVLSTAEAEGADLSALEEPEAMAMMDEDEYKAETPEDEEKAKSVRKAAQFVATNAIKAYQLRSAKQRKAVGKFAKNIVNAAKSEPGESVRDRIGGGHMTPSGNINGAPNHINNLRTKSKYRNLSPEAISYMLDTQRQYRAKMGRPMFLPGGSEDGLADVIRIAADHALESESKGRFYLSSDKYSKAVSIKANELDHTGQSNYGADWVWELWRDQIWEKARLENVVLSNIKTTEMSADVEKLPVEWTDPTVYYVPESTDKEHLDPSGSVIPLSKIGTNKVTFDSKKLALRVAWSAEEEEDSIVRFAEQAQAQSARAMQNAIDFVIVNGDTETGTTNVNYDGGSPTATDRFLAVNGFLKLALVTGSGLTVDGNNTAPSVEKIRQARFKMGREFNTELGNILLFTHPEAYAQMLNIDQFLTMDKVGQYATNRTGQIGMIDGMSVLVTAQMTLAASNGKVSSTGGNNLYGRILTVYIPYWMLGFRRQVTSVLNPSLDGEAWQLTMTTRLDLQTNPENNAASVMYELSV